VNGGFTRTVLRCRLEKHGSALFHTDSELWLRSDMPIHLYRTYKPFPFSIAADQFIINHFILSMCYYKQTN
jgi:hypothetical protein